MGVALDLEAERPGWDRARSTSHDWSVALPASVRLSARTGSSRTVFGCAAVGSVVIGLAVEELERQGDARAADGGGVGHGRAVEAGIVRGVEELGDEATAVRADERHELLARRP